MQRHNNLKKLIDEKFSGSQIDFSRRVGMQPAQVNQWLNGYRSLGERSARKIEQSLGLKKYFLDGLDMDFSQLEKPTNTLSADEKALIDEFNKIKDPSIRREIIGYVRGIATATLTNQAKKSRRDSTTSPSRKKAA